MTTYNTGSPVPSVDVRDLYDNAENLDNFSNGQLDAYADRLGVSRKSLAGMRTEFNAFLAASGFETTVLTYTDGVPLQVDRPTQLIERASAPGTLYSVKLPSSFPVVLSGTWAADETLLVVRIDSALREDLLSPAGTTIIGRGIVTLEDSLLGMEAETAAVSNELSYAKLKSPQLIDMHYGVLRGVGFLAGVEPGGVTNVATTSSVASGQTIPLTDTTSFSSGQLIVYQADDSEYYSAVILSKSAGSVVLRTAIERPLLNGALFANFYTNESHPTVNGYNAITDYALRNLRSARAVAGKWSAADGLVSLGATTVDNLSTLDYGNPGSTTIPAKRVITTGINTGAITQFYDLAAGQYIARFHITPNLVGSSNISIAATVGVVEKTTTETTIATKSQMGNTPTVVELPFFKKSGSTVAFRVLNPDAGTLWFGLAEVEIVRVEAATEGMDKGVHVLLGDSWFAQVGIAERLQSRLPLATIINAGVGGNRADQLNARFGTDVTPHDPDFVWVMTGTNDVGQGVAQDSFGAFIGLINANISTIAAQGIFFNCSVGSTAHSTLGDLLTESRNFALLTEYIGGTLPLSVPPVIATTKTFTHNFSVNVPAGATRRIVMGPGLTQSGLTLNKIYTVGSTGTATGTLRYGFGTSASGTITEDLVSAAMVNTIQTGVAVTKSNANSRLFLVEVNNTTGAAYDIIGFIDALWTPA